MSCVLCADTNDTLLWQDDFCRVVLLHEADYPAYCRVELLAHIKEMTDLPPVDRARMMQVVFVVELAVREIFNPDKINLASLGNKTPHLHWHVVPRFETDRHFPNPHWGAPMRDGQPRQVSADELKALSEKIAAHVACVQSAY